jgi:hypothetical protein
MHPELNDESFFLLLTSLLPTNTPARDSSELSDERRIVRSLNPLSLPV